MIGLALRMMHAILCEHLSRGRMPRAPEPDLVMTSAESVEAFHEQGGAEGTMVPIHHYNALATSRLAPAGGTLLDLGCGSGQYLAYLARRRPDLRIVGVDLSDVMIARGRRALEEAGLSARVRLEVGDMRAPGDMGLAHVDVISCIYALHHLGTPEDLAACLGAIDRLGRAFASAVWIFDFARPRNPRTIDRFFSIFTPDAPLTFRRDGTNSMAAAFAFEDVLGIRQRIPGCRLAGRCSWGLGIHQVHWQPSSDGVPEAHGEWWADAPLSPRASQAFRTLCLTLPLPVGG